MKTTLITLTFVALATPVFAQQSAASERTTALPPGITTSANVSARDGFTKPNTEVIVSRNGVTEKLIKDVVLTNGVRVMVDGTVVLADGTRSTLRGNQILTLDGQLQDVALAPTGVAPVTSAGLGTAVSRPEVGRAARDGITVSGNEAFITRNGVTERIVNTVKLENGTAIQKDGSLTMPDGSKLTLRATQTMTLDGKIMETPARENPATGTGARSEPVRVQ